MNCQSAISSLIDFVDNGLDADMASALSLHLKGCENCRKEEAALRQILAPLGESSAEPSPLYFEALPEKIKARLKAKTRRLSPLSLPRLAYEVFGAALIVAGLLWAPFVWQPDETVLFDTSPVLSESDAALDVALAAWIEELGEDELWESASFFSGYDPYESEPVWELGELSDEELEFLYEDLLREQDSSSYTTRNPRLTLSLNTETLT